ncbi:alanine racemase [Lysobacter korlensis]|uniref:Alanine racemase n=1 Tax=Lysobacter korlensis TaxID=553636 RepID=A0ABV6RXU1_9GAMM
MTPRVVIDQSILRANIERMAAFARAAGIALRPHVKTHKSIGLARMQVDAGATGITVATIGEAEVFAAAGFDDIFVAYPLWVDESNAERLRALMDRTRLRVGIASAEGARQLVRHAPGVEVAVEVDSGHHRTGVSPSAAGELAAAAADAGLQVAGIFTFPGHSYRPGGMADAARQESAALAEARAAVEARDIDVRVISGGSTPTAASTDASVLTEFRPGVYLFNDAQQLLLGTCEAHDVALTVEATVVFSGSTHAVANAGSKMLGADRQDWTDGYGRIAGQPDARIPALSEHHATITGAALREGDRIRILPNHVCTVVNLVDELWVENGTTDRMPVDARGRNG